MTLPSLETGMSRQPSGIASPSHRMSSRSRTQSISSDRPSTIAHSLMSPPLSVSPEAAFIAASAGSQIVTNDHDSHADAWYDQHGVEPSGETALVSSAALLLVNNFLDQLLFNFLSVSRSTSLSSLRPAVSEVLKPKLAKDAVNQADEELREYLGGGDEDELTQPQEPGSPSDWDLELVWKRTRLRCMVYSSLGDMEEEDEDYYMEQESLDTGLEDRLSEVVSPAVAIFLTSILEYMGEQALVVAGQAAYHRMRVKYEKDVKEGKRNPTDIADRIVVEELDMERVALDRTLGRLWRAWKKKIRSPGIGFGMDHALARPYSRDSTPGHLRSPSLSVENAVPATVPEPKIEPVEQQEQVEPVQDKAVPEEPQEQLEPLEEYLLAASIPLPMGDNDVDAIEVPGLASYSDDEDDEELDEQEALPVRPKSLMILPLSSNDLPTPTLSQPHTPILSQRKRSNSLPTPTATPYSSPSGKAAADAVQSQLDEQIETEGSGKEAEVSTDEISVEETEPQATGHDIEATPAKKPHVARERDITEDDLDLTPRAKAVGLPSLAIAATAAGVAVAVRGSGADQEMEHSDSDDGDDVEDFTEEPQIMTSSRISLSERCSSPTHSDYGKPSPVSATMPVRTSSLRLIDVSGPRSPASRSRGSSVDTNEHGRQSMNSRNENMASPSPIAEERRSPDYLSARSAAPINKSGLAKSESISEAEEAADEEEPAPALAPALPISGPYEQMESAVVASQPIFGSAVRHTSPQLSPVRSTTKVTILSSSTSSGTFFIEDRPEVPDKVVADTRPTPSATVTTSPPPAFAERNPNRQAASNASAQAQPASIGMVSVDRSRGRSPSDGSTSRVQDHGSGTRHLHTSGSSSTTSTTTKLKAMRTSEDSSNTRADVARTFEELIQSDQTIQYTLTPESMRDMDTQSTRSAVNGSPVMQVKSRRSEEARQAGERSRSSSVNRPGELDRSTSVNRSTGLNTHPVHDYQPTGPVPRTTPLVPSKPRVNNAPQARDARLPRESLADFAEFIRSTGPTGASISPAAVRANGASAIRSASGPVPVSQNGLDSARYAANSASNRMRLQARDAAVDYKDDNSDLIDFIRRGPPSSGNHRIPRTVAPFRTTMDSDQMSGAVGGKAVDAQIHDLDVRNSQASTSITDYSMLSGQSSINSQSALLGRSKPLPGGNSRYGAFDDGDDMPIPKRKTRRVRDPYAIDLSDEDEFEEQPTPKPVRRAATQEESLVDFLKNVPPPPEPVVQPFNITQMQNRPKKKASAPSLMARFARRDSAQNGSANLNGNTSPKTKFAPESRSLNSRAGGGRGYIPIQVSVPALPSGADKFSSSMASSKAAAQMGMGTPSSAGRVPMKKFEPRDAVSVPSRGTSDLADFFKNSGPPPSMVSTNQYSPPPTQEDSNGFSKVFSRRKKSSVA